MASEALEEKKQEEEDPVEENQEEEEAKAEEPGEDLPEVEEKATENEEEVAGEEGEDETPKKAKRARKASSKSPGESKKRGGDSAVEKKEPVTPVSERPTRERKVVERYSAPDSGRSSATKPLSIEKGSGTQLKDIPNVVFKLSKRKGDENLQLLHTILFGKKAKAHTLKKNIFQFSGYVWAENEQEKQRIKVKEKLDKCVKEKLMDFCDVLDIQINKHSTKKEEVSAKLLEFLESPHATTDILLAEKEQKGKKIKKKVTPSKSAGSGEGSPETPAKKRKDPPSVEKNEESTKDEEDEFDDKVEPSDLKDEPHEEDDDRMNEETDHDHKSDEEEDEQKDQVSSPKSSSKDAKEGSKAKSGGKSTPAKKKTPAKSAKTPTDSEKKSCSTSKRGASDGDGASGSKAKGSVKKQKTEKESSKDSKAKSSSKKQLSKSPAKDQVKGKNSKKAKAEPTKEDVHALIVDILKEVDFNTATLSDILRQLGDHFGIDLMHRKAEVKDIITDVINNMTDEEEEDEDEEAAGDDSVNDA